MSGLFFASEVLSQGILPHPPRLRAGRGPFLRATPPAFFHGINSPNRRSRTKCVWTVATLEISMAAVALLRARWRTGLCDRIVGTGRRCLLDPGR